MKALLVPSLVLLLASLIGCAVPRVGVPMGGSRSDGTVQMGYEYGLFQQPLLDVATTTANASQTCAGWGYQGAQPFGSTMTRCESVNAQGGCVLWLVTIPYQCVGGPH